MASRACSTASSAWLAPAPAHSRSWASDGVDQRGVLGPVAVVEGPGARRVAVESAPSTRPEPGIGATTSRADGRLAGHERGERGGGRRCRRAARRRRAGPGRGPAPQHRGRRRGRARRSPRGARRGGRGAAWPARRGRRARRARGPRRAPSGGPVRVDPGLAEQRGGGEQRRVARAPSGGGEQHASTAATSRAGSTGGSGARSGRGVASMRPRYCAVRGRSEERVVPRSSSAPYDRRRGPDPLLRRRRHGLRGAVPAHRHRLRDGRPRARCSPRRSRSWPATPARWFDGVVGARRPVRGDRGPGRAGRAPGERCPGVAAGGELPLRRLLLRARHRRPGTPRRGLASPPPSPGGRARRTGRPASSGSPCRGPTATSRPGGSGPHRGTAPAPGPLMVCTTAWGLRCRT